MRWRNGWKVERGVRCSKLNGKLKNVELSEKLLARERWKGMILMRAME
jgi:hypothetical protein